MPPPTKSSHLNSDSVKRIERQKNYFTKNGADLHEMEDGRGLGGYLQDVGDHTEGPHVRAVANGLKVDHLGGNKLWGAEEDLELLHRLKSASQPKVYNLDSVP